jgi:hypothetical protein
MYYMPSLVWPWWPDLLRGTVKWYIRGSKKKKSTNRYIFIWGWTAEEFIRNPFSDNLECFHLQFQRCTKKKNLNFCINLTAGKEPFSGIPIYGFFWFVQTYSMSLRLVWPPNVTEPTTKASPKPAHRLTKCAQKYPACYAMVHMLKLCLTWSIMRQS